MRIVHVFVLSVVIASISSPVLADFQKPIVIQRWLLPTDNWRTSSQLIIQAPRKGDLTNIIHSALPRRIRPFVYHLAQGGVPIGKNGWRFNGSKFRKKW